MKVVVTVQHPAHVHFYRHAIAELQDRGHEVAVFAREKEVVVGLLDAFGIDHEVLAGAASSLAELAIVQCTYEARLLGRVRQFQPDVITAIGGLAAAHVGALLDVPSVLFYDTEHASMVRRFAFPFADAVWTPASYGPDEGTHHHRYQGFHELAYLHPRRFEPDPGRLDGLAVDPEEPYVVVRLSDWTASHDVGQGGFEDARAVVHGLERAGVEVVVSAGSALPAALEPYRVRTDPHAIHDLLYHADAVIGEGATMAAESAVLGTPAVYISTLSMGYLDELESRYGLLFSFDGPDDQAAALATAVELATERTTTTWQRRRQRLLSETVDVTAVIRRAVTTAPRAVARPT